MPQTELGQTHNGVGTSGDKNQYMRLTGFICQPEMFIHLTDSLSSI